MAKIPAAVIQMTSRADKTANLLQAERLILEAAAAGAKLVALPEMFNFLGAAAAMAAAAEPVPGPTTEWLCRMARDRGIWLHGGSLLEKVPGQQRVFNTSLLLNPLGEVVATYRKIHLFDIQAGGAVYRESDIVAAGNEIVTAATPWGQAGLSICYDLRFPELYRALSRRGATMLFVPSAFTLATGKDHWDVLHRARAIENQAFVLAAAQIGEYMPGRACFGNAMIVDPWGTVLARAPEQTAAVMANLDLDYLEQVRTRLPALKHHRSELYG